METKLNPEAFGVVVNSNNDQTEKIQTYIDAVGKSGGGVAQLPAGQLRVEGSLLIPKGVILQGQWYAPHHGIMDKGTLLLAYGGRGDESAPALVELGAASGIKGISILYPDQTIGDIQPYPWSIHGTGMHGTVEDVTLINSYNGIAMGPEGNELHLIRNIFGCVLRRGIFIDSTTDIGRIENIHFNPHYWARSGHKGAIRTEKEREQQNEDLDIGAYMQKHLEAFIFGRTDWEYVSNTFVFGAKIGYKFIKTPSGMCNGQFSGIGADASQYCVVVEDIQPMGLLITNGEFVCLKLQKDAEDRVGIVTKPTCNGSVQLSNCAFWGSFTNVMRVEGTGHVSLSQSNLSDWDFGNEKPAIVAHSGRISVLDSFFRSFGPHVHLHENITYAVVRGNLAHGGVYILNAAGKKASITDNEEQFIEIP
jgi:hypothetical protein